MLMQLLLQSSQDICTAGASGIERYSFEDNPNDEHTLKMRLPYLSA